MGQWADGPEEFTKANALFGWFGVIVLILAQPWPYLIGFIAYALLTSE